MDYETYKKTVESIMNLNLDEDYCLEHFTGPPEPSQKSTILYEEVAEEIEKQMQEFQKRKLKKIKPDEAPILETADVAVIIAQELEEEEGTFSDDDSGADEAPSEIH
jgi:hypothetical protein